jgi:NAD(P)-dependent dehydrogenase (short-subunit alcohol dehydrogenase family)
MGCAADDAVARLSEETGHPERLAAVAVDISNPKSIEAAAQTLERDFAGKLGGLINNAAASLPCHHPDLTVATAYVMAPLSVNVMSRRRLLLPSTCVANPQSYRVLRFTSGSQRCQHQR